MASLNGVNTNAEPAKDFELLPIGDYLAVISGEEVKTSKAGFNYLQLTVKIIDGPHKGRLIFGHNLHLWNTNKYTDKAGKEHEVKEIAEGELSAIREAVGIPKESFRDSQQVHNRPVMIRVGQAKDEGYDAKNVIKGWKPVGNSPTAGGSSKPNTPPISSTGSSTAVPSDADVRAFEDEMPEEMRNF